MRARPRPGCRPMRGVRRAYGARAAPRDACPAGRGRRCRCSTALSLTRLLDAAVGLARLQPDGLAGLERACRGVGQLLCRDAVLDRGAERRAGLQALEEVRDLEAIRLAVALQEEVLRLLG